MKHNKEQVLFDALADLANEANEDDNAVLAQRVVVTLAVLKPQLTEQELWQYFRLAGVDMDDPEALLTMIQISSLGIGCRLIELTEMAGKGLVEQGYVEAAQQSVKLQDDAQALKKEMQQLLSSFEWE